MTPDSFASLLAWLNPEQEVAAQKYETIRAGLIRLFIARGCLEAEDLADETFNRVAAKAETLAATYEGNPMRYFYGVADKIRLEYHRRRPHDTVDNHPKLRAAEPAEEDAAHQCLTRCLQELLPGQREFILTYYSQSKNAKIELHKTMAQDLGVSKQGLRTRAFRIKDALHKCIHKCLANGAGA